jgi:hypothetical protein
MATALRHRAQDEQRRALDVPSKVIAAIELLDPDEQASVWHAFSILERGDGAEASDLDITPLYDDLPIYVLAPAPQVRVILRMPPDATIEVLDLLRPETLRMLIQWRQGR